jgi:ligand-binding sensor domain-containing protein/AraC-like DNA-binding protein
MDKPSRLAAVLFLFCLGNVCLDAQSLWSTLPAKPVFSRLGVEDGLSQGTVYAIIQDAKGYLWFGTESGLNRYDGQAIVHYTTQNSGLVDNHITALATDRFGGLWIGTEKGGLHLMPGGEVFIRPIRSTHLTSGLLQVTNIRALMTDRYGFIWIATAQSGLFRCKPETGLMENQVEPITLNLISNQYGRVSNPDLTALHFDLYETLWIGTRQNGLYRFEPYHNQQEAYSLEEIVLKDGADRKVVPSILDIQVDPSGMLWIGTEQGLFFYHPQTHKIGALSKEIGEQIIRDLYLDRKGLLWMATDGSGIATIKLEKGQPRIEFFTHVPGQNTSLSANATEVLYEDGFGVLWVGTFRAGLNRLVLSGIEKETRHRPLFMSLPGFNVSNLPGRLDNAGINAIVEADDHELWLGTESEGLLHLFFKEGEKTATQIEQMVLPQKGQTHAPTVVTSLAITQDRTLWVGTYTDGLFSTQTRASSKSKERLVHYPANAGRISSSPPHPFISTLLVDQKGDLWIGSVGGGLSCRRKNALNFEHAPLDSESNKTLSDRSILSLHMDREHRLWIGTAFGLNLLLDTGKDLSQTEINPLSSISDGTPPIEVQTISALFQDHVGTVWVGTQNNGLYKIENLTGTKIKTRHFSTTQGLSGDMIAAITEDARNHLWISTSQGLSSYDQVGDFFLQFSTAHGLPDNEFFRGSVCVLRGGDILFGSQKGAVLFNPLAISLDPNPPMLTFSGLTITTPDSGKKSLSIGSEAIVHLRQNQFPISIGIGAIHTVGSDHIIRQHRLADIESDWQKTPNTQTVTYPSLPSGTYRLFIRAANRDKLWTPSPLCLTLHVSRPFWKTVPFMASVVFFLSLVLTFLHFWRLGKAVTKERQKYEKTLLSSEQKNAVIKIITDHANETRCYTDPDLTLNKFATLVGLPAHNVSQAINSDLGVSFPDFVNDLRINYAKSLIDRAIDAGTTIKIQNLSNDAGFRSQATFNRAFKKAVSSTPSEYNVTRKIMKAQQVLMDERSESTSLEEIALGLGFSSELNFIRIFKNQIGMTPAQFRKHRGKSDRKSKS